MNCMWSANGDFTCKKQGIEHYVDAPIQSADAIDGEIKDLLAQKKLLEKKLAIAQVQSDTIKNIKLASNNNIGNVPEGPYLKNCSGCKIEHEKILSCDLCEGEKMNNKLYIPLCSENSITVLNKKLVCSST